MAAVTCPRTGRGAPIFRARDWHSILGWVADTLFDHVAAEIQPDNASPASFGFGQAAAGTPALVFRNPIFADQPGDVLLPDRPVDAVGASQPVVIGAGGRGIVIQKLQRATRCSLVDRKGDQAGQQHQKDRLDTTTNNISSHQSNRVIYSGDCHFGCKKPGCLEF